MDNRFTVKDIVMLVLVVAVGLLVLLSMVQKQRQWGLLQDAIEEISAQRESVDVYRQQLVQMGRDQEALRTGVEQMTSKVGEMTSGVNQLVEVLKQSATEGASGPRLGSDTTVGLPGDTGSVQFGAKNFDNDTTFSRVAGLRTRPDFAEGDYFIDAFATTVKSLTPYIAGDIYADVISRYVLESLITIDPDTLEPRPWVAQSWEISEDGLTVTFKMRQDVVFSDGVPMTARDVVFTYEWVMNPKVNAPRMRSYLEKIESVTALDDHTVQFKFREPYFMALTVCGEYLQILPEHWVRRFTEEQYNALPGLLMGSGPYKMAVDPEKWQPGSQKIEVVRNLKYWGPRPALDKVIWREVLEDTARLSMLRNREIDRFGVPASMYRTLSADEQLRRQNDLYEYEYVSRGYFYIGWNQKRNDRPTAFADKRVRQAMTLLIDRAAMCSRVYDNLASPATGPFHPLGWQADPAIKAWPYDPERAKALLAEAGYIDRDANGVRESADGVPLTYEFIYSSNAPEAEQVGLMLKESMRQAGVEVKLNPMDWPVMQQKLDDRNFDSIMLGWGGSVESDLYQMFHSSQSSGGGDNYFNYKSAEFDQAVEEARKTVDHEKCKALWRKAHAILHEDQPYTFMFNPRSVVFFDKRLKNIQVTKMGINYAWEYYVPGPMQLHTGQ